MIQAGTPVEVTSGSLCAEPGIVVGAERPFVVVEIPRTGSKCLVLAEDLAFPAEREERRLLLSRNGPMTQGLQPRTPSLAEERT